jgi:hypothetical protein
VSAGLGVFDAVKAFEDVGQCRFRNADAGIGDLELDEIAAPSELYGDAAVEGVLEGVGEEIEDDFLPHVAVDVNHFGKRRAVDGEREAGLFYCGTKNAGEFRGVDGEVSWLIGGLDAASFDAREVEERVDEFEETETVAVRGPEALSAGGWETVGVLGEFVFERAEHEGEGRAKFVADVGEEGGLGAVDFGEGLGALTLFLIRASVGDGGGDAGDDQIEEGAVGVVEGEARADAGDESTDGVSATGGKNRKDESFLYGFGIWAGGERTVSAREILAMEWLRRADELGQRPDSR